MAIFGQGAPGTRIRLRDLSEVNIVTNPRIVGGVVGFSSRGEFNKVIDLFSTSDMDVILGDGFNNAKFNQGLYAARSIINSGGFVEFVRPYGEAVITDDTDDNYDTSQKLKTDTFLVQYDFSTSATTSINIDHFASTRYITDGLSGIGQREIYTIQKAISENNNINFIIDSDETATDKIPLFAVMNSDPTAAVRAGDKLTISSITASGSTATVDTVNKHGLVVGDTLTVAGTTNFNESDVTVASVVDDDTFTYTPSSAITATETTGVIFVNEDSVTSGVDAITVKTVSAGVASKNYEYLDFTLPVDDRNISITRSDGSTDTYELLEDISTVTSGNFASKIEFDSFNSGDVDATYYNLITTDSGTFSVGDIVQFVAGTGGTLPDPLTAGTNYVISSNSGGVIGIVDSSGSAVDIIDVGSDGSTDHKIYNVTKSAKNFVSSVSTNSGFSGTHVRSSFIGTDVSVATDKITVSDASLFSVSDEVFFSNATNATNGIDVALPTGISDSTVYTVSEVDLINQTIKLTGLNITAQAAATNTYKVTNLTKSLGNSLSISNDSHKVDFIGVYGLEIPSASQDDVSHFSIESGAGVSSGTIGSGTNIYNISTTSSGLLLDNTVGTTFMQLGLANPVYVDIDFDGTSKKVYELTSEGQIVAKIYLYVDYLYNGVTYSFSGTIIPKAVGDTNLYITEAADRVTNATGWKFVINENIALESSTEDAKFDLSQTIKNSLIASEFSQVAFNSSDPAILNNAVWTYNPKNNNTSSILSNAWQLFLDKDKAGADMLVSAGTAISNLFLRGLEQVDFTVMDAMLNICEKRKDMFCVFDGVDESKVDNVLSKMTGIGGQGDIARWGGVWDGRSIFFDSVYTKLNAESVKSIEIASIITLNRAGNVWWLPPAGQQTGRIPGSLAARQKYQRSYNYADDLTSDVARLYDENINPTRVTAQGQISYGQKTMLKKSTALNRMNVIMLIAGIHKRFANFLDAKTFQLNTAALRNNIQAELQAQIDIITGANPAGLTRGTVICNETNNTPDIIDTNQLIVDLVLQPTRSAEFITLRTTVQRTGEDVNITDTTIIGG